MNTWYWQLLAGLIGCVVYYLRRYDPKLPFGFEEYLRVELRALINGVIGFGGVFILWNWGAPLINFALWVAGLIIPAAKGVEIPVLPSLYAPVWAVFGFAGKSLYDTVPRVFGYIGGFLKKKLPQ